jgi:Cellulase (glycosyl hydrolase family 5)
MRRSVGVTLAALLMTAGAAGTVQLATPAREPAARTAATTTQAAALTRLHATAAHAFVDSAGTQHRLIGPNLQPLWDANSTDTWGQSTYRAIKAKGFTAVRMVLFWDMFQPTKAKWNATAFSTLSTAIGRAKAAGLYVILDCVHLSGQPEGQEHVPHWARVSTDGMAAVAKNGLGFLRTIADRYKNEPAVAAYDPVNEPFREPARAASLLADYTKIVNAIRAKNSVTSIMLESSYGDSKVPASAFSSFTPTKRSNLIWSVHDYYNGAPKSGYTNGYSNSTGVGQSPNPSDGTTGYKAANKAALASHLQVQLNTAKAQKLPVWIGEFGIGNGLTGHDQYIKDKVALYKSKGLGYAWWEYYSDGGNGPFSMVDANDRWRSWVGLLR